MPVDSTCSDAETVEANAAAPDILAVDIKNSSSKQAAEARGAAVAIIINAQSGTVRGMGAEAARALVAEAVKDWDCAVSIELVPGSEVDDAVARIVAAGDCKRVIVGGGDGTVTSVAGQLRGTGVALGILPMGTMNVMSKVLGIDAALPAALAQMKDAEPRIIDAARVNGQTCLHHVSFGIQPRMARIRERIGYASRVSKMMAGARAMMSVLLKPQSLRLRLDIDGTSSAIKTPALIVSNNVYEDNAWFRQRRLDEGVLGIYVTRPMSTPAFAKLALDALRGRWRENLNVQEEHGRRVLIFKRRRWGGVSKHVVATIDGEVLLLKTPVTIESDPKSVLVLMPRSPSA